MSAAATPNPADDDTVLRLRGVRKSYNVGTPVETEVLHGIDLALGAHEFVALIGPSGSGKSTLLNLMGLLARPTAGQHGRRRGACGRAACARRPCAGTLQAPG